MAADKAARPGSWIPPRPVCGGICVQGASVPDRRPGRPTNQGDDRWGGGGDGRQKKLTKLMRAEGPFSSSCMLMKVGNQIFARGAEVMDSKACLLLRGMAGDDAGSHRDGQAYFLD